MLKKANKIFISFSHFCFMINSLQSLSLLPSWCQFHQGFTLAFFVQKLSFGSFSSYVLALAPKFRTKRMRENVDEIDGCFHTYLTHSLTHSITFLHTHTLFQLVLHTFSNTHSQTHTLKQTLSNTHSQTHTLKHTL